MTASRECPGEAGEVIDRLELALREARAERDQLRVWLVRAYRHLDHTEACRRDMTRFGHECGCRLQEVREWVAGLHRPLRA